MARECGEDIGIDVGLLPAYECVALMYEQGLGDISLRNAHGYHTVDWVFCWGRLSTHEPCQLCVLVVAIFVH